MAPSSRSGLGPEQSKRLFGLLANLLDRSDRAYSGAFRLVRLSDLARGAGDRLTVEALNGVIERVLAEEIRPPNLFFRQQEDAFCLLFIQAEPARAREIADVCRRAVLAILKEEYGVAYYGVDLAIRRVTREDLNRNPQQFLPNLSRDKDDEYLDDDIGDEAVQEEGGIKMGFRPVWRVSNNLVSVYMTSISRMDGSGETQNGYSALPNLSDLSMVAFYDTMMLDASAQALVDGAAAGARFVLTTPIYYKCLDAPELAKDYFDALDDIEPETMQRLGVQLVGLDAGVDPKRLSAHLQRLSAYSRLVLVQLPLSAIGLSGVAGRKIGAIGASAYGESAADPEMRQRLKYFSLAARRCGAPTFLTGVRDVGVALTAMDLGYEFLAGPFIGEAQAQPSTAVTRTFDEICGRALAV